MKQIKKYRQPTPWTIHLKKVFAEMKEKDPSIKLKDAMKEAKKTYKK
jgi:hypothetical protein